MACGKWCASWLSRDCLGLLCFWCTDWGNSQENATALNVCMGSLTLHSCLMHTYGMAPVTELWQWRHYYYSLVVRWGMKLLYSCGTSPVGEWVLTCDSAHSWWLYSSASLEHQATSTMTCYPTELHYPDTELTSPFPILIMPSARLGSNKYHR